MPGCIVIRDRFGCVHAHSAHGEVNPEYIRTVAGYLAHSVVSTDDGERIMVGLSRRSDPGAARLDQGVDWLYEIDADELPRGR